MISLNVSGCAIVQLPLYWRAFPARFPGDRTTNSRCKQLADHISNMPPRYIPLVDFYWGGCEAFNEFEFVSSYSDTQLCESERTSGRHNLSVQNWQKDEEALEETAAYVSGCSRLHGRLQHAATLPPAVRFAQWGQKTSGEQAHRPGNERFTSVSK